MATVDDAVDAALATVRRQLFERGLTSTGTIVRACKRADFNGNGQLDRKEFDECLRSAGVFLPAADVSLLFRRFDITGDGNVSYDEFLRALKVGYPHIGRAAPRSVVSLDR